MRLKESGFSVAFVGGNKKAKQTDSKYQVPRYIIYKNTSLESFIKMVSNWWMMRFNEKKLKKEYQKHNYKNPT